MILMKKKIKYIITYIYCNYILKLAKVNNNKVVFIITNQCYDNCLAMVFYLSNNLRDIDIKILVDESEFNKYEKLLYNQRNVSVISAGHNFWKSNYELITAKYVFFMHRRPFEHINRRAGQYVINLWHGSGYKDVASTEGTWHEGKDFDYVLVPGDVFVKPKAKFFSCSEERVLAWGYPRYDFFKTKSKNAIEFRNEIIGKDNKFIIWL